MCYARYGRKAAVGPVLVIFHGRPGSRLEHHDVCDWAENLGRRVICIDRPGCGHSTDANEESILEVILGVEELLDNLDIKIFYAYEVSGGGPYALACAYHFPRSRLLASGVM